LTGRTPKSFWFSTKVASNHKRPSEGISQGLADLIRDIHLPFIEPTAPSDLRQLPNYNEYQGVLDKLIRASGLTEESLTASSNVFAFNSDSPARTLNGTTSSASLMCWASKDALYDSLLNAVVEWSISGAPISATDVLDRLGLIHRFIDQVVHDFKVEDRYFIGNPRLFDQLDEAIAKLPGGFILLEGPSRKR
jgi:hypothetical protein